MLIDRLQIPLLQHCAKRTSLAGASINQRFGDRLKALRAKARISEAEFAARLFMPLIRVRALESGIGIASIIEMDAMAAILGLPLAELLSGV